MALVKLTGKDKRTGKPCIKSVPEVCVKGYLAEGYKVASPDEAKASIVPPISSPRTRGKGKDKSALDEDKGGLDS